MNYVNCYVKNKKVIYVFITKQHTILVISPTPKFDLSTSLTLQIMGCQG